MTQKDKDLLFKDLCMRLPYGVRVNHKVKGDFTVYGVCGKYVLTKATDKYGWVNLADFCVEQIKPYLFPLSNMTEEQRKEYENSIIKDGVLTVWTTSTYDWCNKHHFDYRGLIPMELAKDATGLNIY